MFKLCLEVNVMNRIKCTVTNCQHNEHGDCDAKEIIVAKCNCKEAKCCEETSCDTFKPREL